MPENLHITMQFLKEVRSEHLEQLIQNVRHQLQGNIKAFKFELTVQDVRNALLLKIAG